MPNTPQMSSPYMWITHDSASSCWVETFVFNHFSLQQGRRVSLRSPHLGYIPAHIKPQNLFTGINVTSTKMLWMKNILDCKFFVLTLLFLINRPILNYSNVVHLLKCRIRTRSLRPSPEILSDTGGSRRLGLLLRMQTALAILRFTLPAAPWNEVLLEQEGSLS